MFAFSRIDTPRVVCSLPPCGGGLGRGVRVCRVGFTIRGTPTPNPTPQGGGEQTARVAKVIPLDRKRL